MSYDSDRIKALQRVYALRSNYSIAAVNLSIGGSLYSDQGACDAENVTYKSAVDALRSVSIATVIAAGNNGAANALSSPGCISSALVIGSVEKNDTVSGFSNAASFLELLSPGGGGVLSIRLPIHEDFDPSKCCGSFREALSPRRPHG
jgi:subtilisin family serine protease